MLNVLLTCPPMINRLNHYIDEMPNWNIHVPEFSQTVSENKLLELVPQYDVWIIGDDIANEKILNAGKNGKLKILIKWGIGTDNINIEHAKNLGIKFSNTPAMFGNEVADVAIGYLISITRHLCQINNSVRKGIWLKPSGISLSGKKISLFGYGSIGREIAKRLLSMGVKLYIYDPGYEHIHKNNKEILKSKYNDFTFPILNNMYFTDSVVDCLKNSKAVILSCPLTSDTKLMINKNTISLMDDECYIVNVSRGQIVNEKDVVDGLKQGKIKGFASDVFWNEPLNDDNELLNLENVIFGSHNASNTVEAVDRTSFKVIKLIKEFINQMKQ